MVYRDLLNKREGLCRDSELVSKDIAELLEPVCYDVLDIFNQENIQFEVNGISAGDIFVRVPRLLRIKNYPEIPKGDYEINPEYVRVAIKNLVNKERILETRIGTYSLEPVAIRMKKS